MSLNFLKRFASWTDGNSTPKWWRHSAIISIFIVFSGEARETVFCGKPWAGQLGEYLQFRVVVLFCVRSVSYDNRHNIQTTRLRWSFKMSLINFYPALILKQWMNTDVVVQLIEYWTRNQEVAGSTHTRFTVSNLEQVANLLCAQANSASYPQRDGKWVVATATVRHGSNCPLARAVDGHIMRCGTTGSCQSAATSEIVKRCWSRVWLV